MKRNTISHSFDTNNHKPHNTCMHSVCLHSCDKNILLLFYIAWLISLKNKQPFIINLQKQLIIRHRAQSTHTYTLIPSRYNDNVHISSCNCVNWFTTFDIMCGWAVYFFICHWFCGFCLPWLSAVHNTISMETTITQKKREQNKQKYQEQQQE